MAKLKVAGSCWEAEQRMIRAEEQAKENAMEAGRLRAEVAALRERAERAEAGMEDWRQRLADALSVSEYKLAEARALLVRWLKWTPRWDTRAGDIGGDTNAFLRGDEAPGGD